MTRNYAQRGKAAQILEHMQAHREQAVFSGRELVLIAGIQADSVSNYVDALVNHGLIHTTKQGRERLYSLEPFPEPEKDPLPEFTAALWADGELVLSGVREADGGGFILSAEQASQVKRLLTGAVA